MILKEVLSGKRDFPDRPKNILAGPKTRREDFLRHRMRQWSDFYFSTVRKAFPNDFWIFFDDFGH